LDGLISFKNRGTSTIVRPSQDYRVHYPITQMGILRNPVEPYNLRRQHVNFTARTRPELN